MAAIDFGAGPNTPTGDLIPAAVIKLQARLVARGFDPGPLGVDAASALAKIEAACSRAEAAYTPGTALSLTLTGTAPPATVGAPYFFAPGVAYATGPVAFTLNGTLPSGLLFDVTSGAVSGTPAAAATFTGSIGAADAKSSTLLNLSFVVAGATVVPAPTLSQPSISPTSGAVGSTFTAIDGAVTNGTLSGRRWLLDTTAIGTGSTITPNAAGSLTLEDTALGTNGATNTATSAAVTVSAAVVPVPVSTAVPTISGTPQEGQTLTASTGAWTNNPTSYAYQWFRAGVAISGSVNASRTLTSADVGSAMSCGVIASNDGGASAQAVSAATSTVSAATVAVPANTVAPAISGTPTVGQTLSVSNGTWSGSPTSYAYQWRRGGLDISGATSSSYALVPADAGTSITCRVTATNAGGSTGAISNAVTIGTVAVPLTNYKTALSATKAGTSRTQILMVGDSTTAGHWGGTTANGATNNARAGSVPFQLQDQFVSKAGLPFAGKNMFGCGSAGAAASQSTLQGYNGELYVGTGWATAPTATFSAGGQMLTRATNTADAIGYLDTTLDTVEVYVPHNTTLDSAAWVKIGGVAVGTINQTGSPRVTREVFTGASGTSIGIDQGGAATGSVYIIGFNAYNSANKGVQCINVGWGGSTSADWASQSGTAGNGPIDALPQFPASLKTICLGINDWQNGISVTDYKANLTAIYNTLKNATCDVMFIGPNRTSTTITPQATQESYVQAMREVAATVGAKFVDIAGISGFADYATANAAGYMGDVRHPNRAGYGVIAAWLYDNVIGNPA